MFSPAASVPFIVTKSPPPLSSVDGVVEQPNSNETRVLSHKNFAVVLFMLLLVPKVVAAMIREL